MSRNRVDRAKVTVAQTTWHLTFAVLLNSKQSCSSSLSFLEAITGLGTAKTVTVQHLHWRSKQETSQAR